MTYRKGTKLLKSVFNLPMTRGGLGDIIGQLPAIVFALKEHPQVSFNLWLHSYAVSLCEKVFEPYKNRIKVFDLKDKDEHYIENLQYRSPYVHKISNLSWHITDHAFATIVGRQVQNSDKNYVQLEPIDVSSFNLPENYVVITTAYTSKTRVFKPEYVKEVSEYCISKGYTPVYIGKSLTMSGKNEGIFAKIECDYSNGINLIDKTNLFEAHAIMAGSKCVIGVDNGLCPHLAAMSNVPIVVGFTSVSPEHRLPVRNNELGWNCYIVQPPEKLGCRFCQSRMNFADPKFSFTNCAYDDFLCNDELKPELWIEQLQKIL